MRVLVIGQGGREHALVWRLNQSPSVRKIFCATGNPGINQHAEPVPIPASDRAALVAFARANQVDLTVVGPDAPLGDGIVDDFAAAGLRIFGPSKAAARIETSKSFAKEIMARAGVSTAAHAVFDDANGARRYVRERGAPIVVKADGLALGKGVTVCLDVESAIHAIDEAMEAGTFGKSGDRVVIEEFLTGEEISFFALCDGECAIPFGSFQDHKAIFDGDRGPNTGGMGAYSPVPRFTPALEQRVMREIVEPVLRTLAAQGVPFRGLLFAGLMVDDDRISVVEFNARFGDPESQALMMRFEGDLGETLLAAAEGRARGLTLRISPKSAATVVLASSGYPGEYRKGVPIR
ncbi:MAG TPA: phosphoribosylamine--glycine ligase, partial [Candidatus Binataceae bacterium]|nr:phosphoribosylamine--glycine ligase [Candidatus Binataceae bacterium]